MRKFVAIVLLLSSFNAYSQKRKIYFVKNNGDLVKNKDQADFTRIVYPADSGSVYKVREFYANGVRKLIGTASEYWPKVIWQGANVIFDKEGRKTQDVIYQNGVPTGPSNYFFPNGQLMMHIEYNNTEGMEVVGNKVLKFKLVDLFDSTGVQLVNDGSGYVKETLKNGAEEGNYVNGVREGIWKGIATKDGSVYEDYYKSGWFVSGKSLKPGGEVITYTRKEVLPNFPGGKKALMQYLRENLSYPPEAREKGISGRVVVGFIVEEDGRLANIRVISSPDRLLEREALRVIESSPKWEPGTQNGIPLRAEYELPLSFSLKQADQTPSGSRTTKSPNAIPMRF